MNYPKMLGVVLDKRTNGLIVSENMEDSKWYICLWNVVHVHDLVDFVTEEAKELVKMQRRYKGEK